MAEYEGRWNVDLFKLFLELTQLKTLLQPASVASPECLEVSRRFIELHKQPKIAMKPFTMDPETGLY